MSPLFTLLGKLLVQNNALASSLSCCCGCVCPTTPYETFCSCIDISIGTNSASASVKLGSFPLDTGTKQIPAQADGDIPSSTLEYSCTTDGPEGNKGWTFTYTMSGRSETWSLFVGETIGIIQDIKNVDGKCCPQFGTCIAPNGWVMTPDIVLEDTPAINLAFYEPCSVCEDTKCLPKTWQLYDTTNQKVLDYGDIVSLNPEDPKATDYILKDLESEFKPWGYYSKTFNVELRIYCEDDLIGEKIWDTTVNIGDCGDNRYPVYPYNTAPWKRKICLFSGNQACLYDAAADVIEISMNPGGKTRSGNVSTYVGAVPNNYDYSNIFNWTGGTYNKNLPTSSTNVFIQGSCLEDGSGAAVCNNLTISGNFKFGIAITASGRVLVENGAHVIDEKYNTVCTDLPVGRGHITCSGAGDVSTSTLVGYQYNGAVIFNYVSILSGTVTYSGSHNVAVTFSDGAYISDNGTITGGDHILFWGAKVAKFNDPLSLDVPTPTYNGKWIFVGGSENRGGLIVTPQYVEFYSFSGGPGGNTSGAEPGRITTANFPVKFYGASNGKACQDSSRSWPDGIVTHDAEFYSFDYYGSRIDGYNAGKVEGDADFYGNSYNAECADDIDGQATFWNTSCNRDTITGNPIFNDNSSNGCPGSLLNTIGKIIGNPIFNDTAHNTVKIEGNPIFNENSYNDTTGVIDGDPTFNNNAYSTGTINGNPVFYNNAQQKGNVVATSTVVFHNDSQMIDGQITGGCSFLDSSSAYNGTIIGNCSFSNYAGCGAKYSYGNWNYNTSQSMILKEGNYTFDDNTLNNGLIHVSSGKSCVFNGSSVNDGGYVTSGVGVPSGGNNYSITFNGTSRNGKLGSSRTSTVMGGNVTFNSGTGNGYPGVGANVSAYNVVFNGTGSIGSVQNYGYVTGSNSVSMTYGYNNNNASITGPTTLTNSENTTGATITGNTSFVSSKNYGTVTGDADFNATSCNSGTVTGTITGSPPAC